jgi:cytochrome P450
MTFFQIRSTRSRYVFPPGLEHNLLWYAFRKFRPHDPIRLFQDLAGRFGDIAHYRIGPEHIVFLNHPDYIREILVVQNANFVKERTVQRTKMLLGEGMITSEGQDHRRQRMAAQPAFHRQRIPDYACIMVEEALLERESWRPGTTIDVSQRMMNLSLAIVSRTLFSTRLGSEAAELTAAINRIMDLYHYLVLLPAVEVLVHLRAPKIGRFATERARLDAVVNRMIEGHRKTRGARQGKEDLLDMMIDSEEGTSDSEKRLRDQVITVFLAGYETVANALTWTWYLLSQNPGAEQRFHSEVDEVLEQRPFPNVEDVQRLRYSEMVVAESMRLYPPAWAMGRRALNDFHLGSYSLPARTTLLMCQYVTHRESRFFPEPLRFMPERWTDEAKAKLTRLAYFPFGAGGRQCIGESFAWMEAVLVLATLAQKWKLRLVPGHRVEPQPLITLRPHYGMRMEVEARTPIARPSLQFGRAI